MSGYNRPECSKAGCGEPVVGRKLCRKHYQAAWKSGEFVNAPLKPRKRNRVTCPPEHKHAGSSTCYIQHQCRCDACMDHHSAMTVRREKLKAYGRWDSGLVDAEPVREHMIMLGEFGLGYKRIAALAGIGVTATRNIIWGRQDSGPRYGELQKRVKRETAEALLAVKPDVSLLAGGVVIPARGVHRRVQALVRMGWSQAKIGARVGIDSGNFWTLMKSPRVTVKYHRAIAALFDELWNVEPPRVEWRDKIAYARAIGYAKQRRWLGPLAWDDIDNDVEPPVPDEVGGVDDVVVHLAVSGDHVRLTPAERRAAVAVLHASRLSDNAIAERLHITDRTVLRIRQELELPAALGFDKQPIYA